MEFEILYKKRTNDRLWIWQIKMFYKKIGTERLLDDIESYKQKNQDKYHIVYKTYSGLEEGKIKESGGKVIRTGKQKRTLYEQAMSEIESKYAHKIDREGYSKNKTEAKKSIVFRPQKLKALNKVDINTGEEQLDYLDFENVRYYVQPKLDGQRVIISKNVDGGYEIVGRKLKKFYGLDFLDPQLKIFGLKPGIYLDGELVIPGKALNEITSILHLQEDSPKKHEIIVNLFDQYDSNKPELPFKTRYNKLGKLFKKADRRKIPNIKIVKSYRVDSFEDIRKKHDEFVKQGHEGIVIRDINQAYKPDKRTDGLYKWKYYKEQDYTIAGFFAPNDRKEKGAIMWILAKEKFKFKPTKQKIVQLQKKRLYKNVPYWIVENIGLTFAVRPMGSVEERKQMFEIVKQNPQDFIGKEIQIYYQDVTGKNHFPKFSFASNSKLAQLIPKII